MKETVYIQSFYTYEVLENNKGVKYNYMLQYIINGEGVTNVCIDVETYSNYSTYTDAMYQKACGYYGGNLGDNYHFEINHYNIK